MNVVINVRSRESEHPSESESKDHYTAVCQDENGKYIATEHFGKK